MDKRVIKKGMEALVRIDKDVANAVAQVGYPAPRLRPVGFETLFTAILSQQISTRASRAIRERVIALMDDVSAKSLLLVDSETLRSAGMSYRKIEYAKAWPKPLLKGDWTCKACENKPTMGSFPPLQHCVVLDCGAPRSI